MFGMEVDRIADRLRKDDYWLPTLSEDGYVEKLAYMIRQNLNVIKLIEIGNGNLL